MNSVVVPDALLIALNRYLKAQREGNEVASDQVLCNCPTTMNSNSITGAAADPTMGAIATQLMPQGNLQEARQKCTSQQVWNAMPIHSKPADPVLHSRNHQSQNSTRQRSLSAPTESTRDCQRGADKFCHVPQPNPHNFMGLQPSQSNKQQQHQAPETRQYPKLSNCSNCCGSGAGRNAYQMNNMSFEPQQQEPSCHMGASNRIGMNYEQYFQQQQQQQQQPQQRQQSSQYVRNEDSLDDFQPMLNSTMIAQDYRDNAGRPLQCTPQQQQQQQHLQQHQQQQQQQQQYISQYGQNQGQAYGACCMQQQPTSATSQGQYSSQQRMQYPDLPCQVQHELGNSYNETSYRQLPQRSQGMQKSAPNQVSFRDGYAAENTIACPVGTGYQSNLNLNQGSCYQEPNRNDSRLNQSNHSDNPITLNLGKTNTPSCQDTPVTPINYMTHEELYVHRAQTVFFETLVLDRNCPGIIQDSLDGRENFNQYAFQIAFGDKIPNEPHPIDPMSMLEAIKTRIDYEREEIHKKCPTVRDENSKHPTNRNTRRSYENAQEEKYFKNKDSKRKRRSQTEMTAQEQMSEDIDRHFSSKNKSEVNESIFAFLKAENDYSTSAGHSSKNFSANVNSHESNFLGLPIKTRVYTATTWPID